MVYMYQNKIEFEVPHRPCPQPRPKARRLPMGVQIYTPNSVKVKAWKGAVKEGFERAVGNVFFPVSGLVKFSVDFVINRPLNMCGTKYDEGLIPHLVKPDIDNLLKSTLDALYQIAWNDDSQIWLGECRKFFGGIEFGGKSGRKRIPAESIVKISIEY